MSKKHKKNQGGEPKWLIIGLVVAIIVTNVIWVMKINSLQIQLNGTSEQSYNALIQAAALRACIDNPEDSNSKPCNVPKYQNLDFTPKY